MKSWRKWLRGLAVLAGVTMTVVAVAGFFLPSSLVVEVLDVLP